MSNVCPKKLGVFFVVLMVSTPFTALANWTDNLLFYAPFTDPDNPLTLTTGTGSFTYTRAAAATYINPNTNLVTMSAANAARQSEDFSNATWVATSTQVTINQVTAPDGTLTADLLTVGPASDGSMSHYMQMNATSTITVSQVYSAGVYIKANTNTWVAVALVGKNGTANTCYFNTSTGAIGTCSGISVGTSTVAANGFYRFGVSATLSSGSATVAIRVYLASANGTTAWVGDNTSSFYAWGAQINSGPILAPYVRTLDDAAATARIESGGYLSEGTRTNSALWSRDMTNAVWTKTNTTAALTATGHDGSLNSASTITATADNGTVCQSLTIAIATTSASVDIKRITGTGTISLSVDGGSTYTSDVSSSLSTSAWYRAVNEGQRLANPSFCIKLGTNGDSVVLDYAQVESASFISSRIPTTSTANTRYLDRMSIPSDSNWPTTEGSFFVIGDTWDTATSNKFFTDGTNPARVMLHIRSGQGNGSNGTLGRTTIYDGASECSYGSVNVQPQTSTKMATRWSATSGTRASTASAGTPASCVFDGSLEVITPMVLGDSHSQDGSRTLWGHMKQVRIWSTAMSDAQMILATNGGTTDIGLTPTISASTASSLSTTGVTLNGDITDDGGATTTTRGFEYGLTTSYGTQTSSSGTFSTGTYSSAITGLTCGTSYNFRAYATNSTGTASSSNLTFTTSACITTPTTLTTTFTSITTTSVIASSTISALGGENSTDRGFAYGITTEYSSGTTTDSGSWSISDFSQTLSSLSCGTTYYVRPYAINSAGTGFGSSSSFTTSICSDNSTTTRSTHTFRRPTAPYQSIPVTVTTVVNNPVKISISSIISPGKSGVQVKNLQQFLNSQGFVISTKGPGSIGNETTFYGALTRAAVIRFQKRYSIDPIGIVGPKTLAKIQELMR